MAGTVEWSVLIAICGLIVTAGISVGGVTWALRGMIAGLEKSIVTQISGSQDRIREEAVESAKHIESNIIILHRKLDEHSAIDAASFRALGERLARMEGKG